MESETGAQVNTILQLRVHPAIVALREKMLAAPRDRKVDVNLTYITPRSLVFAELEGRREEVGRHRHKHRRALLRHASLRLWRSAGKRRASADTDEAAGYLEYERARVRWFLSVDINDVPPAERAKGKRTYRAITADGADIEFSDGFTDLHTRSYEEILAGRGFGLEENRVAIGTVAHIRNAPIVTAGEVHPFARDAA